MSNTIHIKQKVHFLHIGKTGGSAIRSVLDKNGETSTHNIITHGHATSIQSIPTGEKIIFFLRDPISRFISGFYSRKRKGQPRYNVEWKPLEKKIFTTFETPNELALALSDTKLSHHDLAINAMDYVQHLRHYDNWYIDFEYFNSRLEDIFFIGFQESLDEDFVKLKAKLSIDSNSLLPTDNVGAHRNPEGLDKHLDSQAKEALLEHYKEDIKFYNMCKTLVLKN
ncbi:MAG: sulfotransferase family 2 domain-containing protein [Campylobacterota bacterium]|nr:sulfotransferase family 2 domain-containing protein [Campylobacterota bacterium]